AVVPARGGRRVEDEVVEVQPAEVDAPGRDGLALEDLVGLQPLGTHPVRLTLDLRELLDDLARDALACAQLTLVVLDDGAGLGDSGSVSGGQGNGPPGMSDSGARNCIGDGGRTRLARCPHVRRAA